MRRIVSFLYAFVSCIVLYAQLEGYSMHPLPTQGKMPIGNVHGIFRDSEGYMWYSTEENLCRDNGYQVDVFCSDANNLQLLASNFILDIAEDKRGNIWFGTANGTYLLDKANYSIRPIRLEEAKGKECEALMGCSDGSVWLSVGDALYHLDANEKLLHQVATGSRRTNGKYASAFYEDRHNNIWLIEHGGTICRFDNAQQTFVPYDMNVQVNPQRMVEDPVRGGFWLATWGDGIVKFLPSLVENKAQCILQNVTCDSQRAPSNKGQVIDLMLNDNASLLWVTTMEGLYAYQVGDDGRLKEMNTGGLLPSGKHAVNRMEKDRNQHIWVAGLSPHTFILTSPKGQLRREKMNDVASVLGTNVIVDFCIADGNYLWIWDPRLGLQLHHLITGKTVLAMNQKEDASMRGSGVISPRSGNGMWMASDSRILALEHQNGAIQRQVAFNLPDHVIFGLYDDRRGAVWAATSRGVKKVAYEGHAAVQHMTDSTEMTFRIAVDRRGNYYYHGLHKGLVAVDAQTGASRNLLASFEQCTCMTLDAGDVLWYGTHLGRVYRYAAGDSLPTLIEGLGNDSGTRILDIKRDGKGHVWAVSSQSVKEWNPENGAVHAYVGHHPNINMDYFRTLASLGDTICVAGADGLCMIASSSLLNDTISQTHPIVSSVIIDGEKQYTHQQSKEVEVSSSSDMLELCLTTFNHLYAPHIQFAYRLRKTGWLGIGNDSLRWHLLPKGENVIRFSVLPKGHYTVEVKATDPYGMWGKPVDAFVLHRLPAWWETWWAQCLYACLLVFFCVSFFKLYAASVRKKKTMQMEEEVTKMKFQFFTNLSHELRTPLTLIMLPLEKLRKKQPSAVLTASDCKQLESIHRNAQDLLELINQMLDFRRMELGNIQMTMVTVDLVEFLRDAKDAFSPLAENKDIRFSLECEEKNLYISMDRERIRHVVWNLLSNAFKFTKSGGDVSVKVERGSQSVKVSVSDTGIGISKEDAAHIFERYYQAAGNPEHGGSGIGLHFVNEIVQMHGGETGMESELGKGSVFWFTLPLHAVKTEPGLAKETEASVAQEEEEVKKHILLVEDNAEFRKMLADELRELGYVVSEAGHGVAAIQLLEQQTVELIVSDVMMPEMDGFQLCRWIKTNEAFSHIPVVLLTAKTGDENALEGYKMGADCYVTKPFSMDLLKNRIEHLLNQQEVHQQAFQQDPEMDVSSITRSKLDEEFLEHAMNVMEQHMGDVNFSVKEFSDEMCTSRMTLYRKIQTITGLTPSDFMVRVRMKRAAKLLKETSYPIAIISEMTGFSSPSYFTKTFKATFGELPKDVRRKG